MGRIVLTLVTEDGVQRTVAVAIHPDDVEEARADLVGWVARYAHRDLSAPVDDLRLPARATNCLRRAGIETLLDLVRRSEVELLSIASLGETSLDLIRDALAKRGLSLRDAAWRNGVSAVRKGLSLPT
jgi:DNA-directed RNA polymerase subunit alpha